MIARVLSLILIGAAAPAALAQPARPSFDCAKAATASEKRICREPALARLDADIAAAFGAALRLLDDAGKAALRKDQQRFVHVRDIGPDFRDFDLKAQMESRRDFLRRIRKSGGAWTGTWANLFGEVEVKREGAVWTIGVEAAEPVNGRWICGISQTGRLADGAILAGPAEGAKPGDDPDEGWRHRITVAGDALSLQPLPPEGKFDAPYCGHNGTIEGAYLPVRPQATR